MQCLQRIQVRGQSAVGGVGVEASIFFLIAGPTHRKMPTKRLTNASPTTKKLRRISPNLFATTHGPGLAECA